MAFNSGFHICMYLLIHVQNIHTHTQSYQRVYRRMRWNKDSQQVTGSVVDIKEIPTSIPEHSRITMVSSN